MKKITKIVEIRKEMARLDMFVVGLLLAIAFNFVACEQVDEILADVEVVSDMDKYLEENPGLEVQELVKEVKENGPSQYLTLTYRLGYRIAGKKFEISTNQR